jgi:tetratricopeptide (TPR) repeat protein
MILEQHYDDAVLIAFLGDEPAARRDPHLISCHPCAETLSALRTMAEALEDETVWELRELDDTPRQSTIDTLRAKQRELAGEDAAAAPRLKQLLAQPREMWAGMVEAHPEWRTAGMVRAMVGEAERIVTSVPPIAADLAQLAVGVSNYLKDPGSAIAALRTQAYVLYFTGQYPIALRATDTAEGIISQACTAEVEVARLRYVRALILADIGRDEEAFTLAAEAAGVFSKAGDQRRYISAIRTQGIALYHLRRHPEALALYGSVLHLCEAIDRASFAGLTQNMALCYREMGDFEKAIRFFLVALDTFQRLGITVGIAKTRWHLGRTFLAQGKISEALSLLTEVRNEFEELTMGQDVALVTIDIAQALVVSGRNQEVMSLCHTATEYFRTAELLNTEGALTAMALLREAAAGGRLSDRVIVDARARVERTPVKLFARVLD